MDQIVSQTPGLIAQMEGKPTHRRYRCATVFVDQSSDLSYIVLLTTTGIEETLKLKAYF